ncbi:G-protein coupled receptor moody isoform X2 [Planococcus citri]|uniref:G-protein coupled receptor moody isoform X2 n=1 Tax=Planococcus citri TaxID=170843 RepID=UPI0031F8CFDB
MKRNADDSPEDILLFAGYSTALLQFAAMCCLLFMIVGILGNLITIVALLGCKKELNATAIFIINLSASDFMFCVFNLPLAASTFWLRRWKQGYLVCQLYPLMRYGLVAVSLFTILAITINRYIMISHPNIYPKLYRKEYLLLMVASTWLCAFGTLVPTWFGKWGRFGLDVNVGSCSILPDDDGYSPKQFLFIVAFVIPCFFIAICYARIFYIVRMTARRSHTMTNRNNTVTATITTASAVTTASGQQNSTEFYPNKLKRLPQLSTEDSAIGSSGGATSSTEKSSSVIVNENESCDNYQHEPIVPNAPPCPNLLSPPIRPSYYAKIAVEPSSSSGLDDDYVEDYASSRSMSPTSLCSSHRISTRIRKKPRERTPSAVNATFNQMAAALRRKSPISFNPRRRSALPQPGKMSSKDKKLLKMILVIFSSFVICYLPITITKTSKYLSEFPILNIGGYLLIYLTTCINPIIYVVMSSEYRQAYKNLLTCRSSETTRSKRMRK